MSNQNRPSQGVRISQILHEQAEEAVPDQVTVQPQVHAALASSIRKERDLHEQRLASRLDAVRPRTSTSRTRWASTNLAALLPVLLVALTIGVGVLLATRDSGMTGTTRGDAFVPEGKVRHVVISYTHTLTDLDANGEWITLHDTATKADFRFQQTGELWYTQGSNHPLLFLVGTITGTGSTAPQVSKSYSWVDEDTIYNYDEVVGQPPGGIRIVRRSAYRPDFFELYGPDPDLINKKLNLPGGQLIGNSILNGRPVVEIQTASTGYPPEALTEADVPPEYYAVPSPTPEARSSQKELIITRWRMWIDTNTLQPLRWQYSKSYIRGPRSGQIETQESNVVLDEIRDLGEFPPDNFKFSLPPGYELQDYEFPTRTVPPSATPTASNR